MGNKCICTVKKPERYKHNIPQPRSPYRPYSMKVVKNWSALYDTDLPRRESIIA